MENYNCRRHGTTKGVANGKNQRRCAACNSERVMRRQRKLKQDAVTMKGGKCSKCGYNKCLSALEFHHEDPSIKEGNPNKFTSWSKLKKEIEFCILVCSNCHREIHEEDRNGT